RMASALWRAAAPAWSAGLLVCWMLSAMVKVLTPCYRYYRRMLRCSKTIAPNPDQDTATLSRTYHTVSA
ncbi:MAG TPA: hypothetical protein VJ779_05025, partial [Acetobacteraceae bacterium]|nr:hypothetical protein [Acetobacteraceae bacterium]